MIETACKKRIRRVTRCWIKTDFHRRAGSARPIPELKFRLVGFELIPNVKDWKLDKSLIVRVMTKGASYRRKSNLTGSSRDIDAGLSRVSSRPFFAPSEAIKYPFPLIKIINTPVANRGNRRTTAPVISQRRHGPCRLLHVGLISDRLSCISFRLYTSRRANRGVRTRVSV
jgi:hypothetical protein